MFRLYWKERRTSSETAGWIVWTAVRIHRFVIQLEASLRAIFPAQMEMVKHARFARRKILYEKKRYSAPYYEYYSRPELSDLTRDVYGRKRVATVSLTRVTFPLSLSLFLSPLERARTRSSRRRSARPCVGVPRVLSKVQMNHLSSQ